MGETQSKKRKLIIQQYRQRLNIDFDTYEVNEEQDGWMNILEKDGQYYFTFLN